MLSSIADCLRKFTRNYSMVYLVDLKTRVRKAWQSRIARNGLYNLVGLVASVLFMLVFTPLLVHRMGIEEYGIWMVATSVLGLMGMFQMGLGTGVVKYVAEYSSKRDEEGVSSVVIGTIVLYLAIGILLTVPLYYMAPKIALIMKTSGDVPSDVGKSIRVISLGFIPMLLMGVALAVPMGLQSYGISSIFSIVKLCLTQTVALIVVLLGGHAYQVIISSVIILWICSFTFLVIAIRMLLTYGLRFFFLGGMDVGYFPFRSMQ